MARPSEFALAEAFDALLVFPAILLAAQMAIDSTAVAIAVSGAAADLVFYVVVGLSRLHAIRRAAGETKGLGVGGGD